MKKFKVFEIELYEVFLNEYEYEGESFEEVREVFLKEKFGLNDEEIEKDKKNWKERCGEELVYIGDVSGYIIREVE